MKGKHIKVISYDTKIGCPSCNNVNTAKDWEQSTYAKCTTRDMRRDFTPILERKAFSGKCAYVCPMCDVVVHGKYLKVMNEDGSPNMELGNTPTFSARFIPAGEAFKGSPSDEDYM